MFGTQLHYGNDRIIHQLPGESYLVDGEEDLPRTWCLVAREDPQE